MVDRNLADTKIPNAAQFAKEAKEAQEELVRRLRALELRKQALDVVVRLAEHVSVGDPVVLAQRICHFLEDVSPETEAPKS